MPKSRKYYLQIMFKTEDPTPPSMKQFYKSMPKKIESKWFYQEYAVGGSHKGERHIGYTDLSGPEVSVVIAKAKKFFPRAKFKQEEEV